MKSNKNPKRILQTIRKAEAELVSATPKRAAKLAEKLVRLKRTAFQGIKG